MRLITALTEPASVKPILEHLSLPTEPPALAPARTLPLDDVDQTPAFDLTDPEPAPDESMDGRGTAKQDTRAEYEFNQTVS